MSLFRNLLTAVKNKQGDGGRELYSIKFNNTGVDNTSPLETYINTGITPKQSHKVTVTYKAVSNLKFIFGSRVYGNVTSILYGYFSSNKRGYISFGTVALNVEAPSNLTGDDNIHTATLEFGKFTIDGVEVSLDSQEFTFSDSANYCLGSIYSGNISIDGRGCDGYIYNFKIEEDGKLIQNLIPYLDKDGVPCFKDTVTGKLFYNQGTGEFTYEEIVPTDYLQVEYIETVNYAYIDTGISNKPEYSYKIKSLIPYNSREKTQALFGQRREYGDTEGCVLFFGAIHRFDRYKQHNYFVQSPDYWDNINEFFIKLGELYINGNLKTSLEYKDFTPIDRNVYLFAVNDNGIPNMIVSSGTRVYSYQVLQGDEIIQDLVPVIYLPTGEVGMWDTVNRKFLTNANTNNGSFTAGYNVPEEYTQISTVNFDGNHYIDTGILTAQDLELYCKFKTDVGEKLLFGGRGTKDSNALIFGYFQSYSTYIVFGAQSGATPTISYVDSIYHAVKLNQDECIIDNINIDFHKGTLTEFNTITLGTWHTASIYDPRCFNGDVDYFIIKKAGKTILHYVPVQNGTENGFYDLVTKKFMSLKNVYS